MILQSELEEERRARKQQGERADLAHKALHDRQAELDPACQRITAAEAASHEGKNKAQVILQLFFKIDIFHSVWDCLSFNGFQLQMSLDPFSRCLPQLFSCDLHVSAELAGFCLPLVLAAVCLSVCVSACCSGALVC